ncbi:hypothetical protein ACWEDF_32645, partial [Micromonospora chersina]
IRLRHRGASGVISAGVSRTRTALTDEGMRLLEQAAPGHVDTVRSMIFDRLSPEQVGQLEEIFTAIGSGLQGDCGHATGDEVPWRRRASKPCS